MPNFEEPPPKLSQFSDTAVLKQAETDIYLQIGYKIWNLIYQFLYKRGLVCNEIY